MPAIMLIVFGLGGVCPAVTLDSDRQLALTWSSFTNLVGADDTIVVQVEVVATNFTWSLFYDWADKNGNQTGIPATPHLNLGSYRIYADKGDYVSGGRRDDVVFNLNGGSISGNVDAVQLQTASATSDQNAPSGNLTITNVADMSLGRIATGGSPGHAGDLTIGSPARLAGDIRVSGIVASGRTAGRISIYGSGDVLIQTGSGTATNIEATIITAPNNAKDSITIHHDGAFVARDILAAGPGSTLQSMEFQGDSLSNGVSGTFEARHLDNSGYYGGPIEISGYREVVIRGDVKTRNDHVGAGGVTVTNVLGKVTIDGSIDVSTQGAAGTRRGGNVVFSAGGDIRIGGSLNLNSAVGDAYDGDLNLESVNGAIGLSCLVLTNMGYAAFQATGKTTIAGAVVNFATNHVSGAGVATDPYVTTQTELRAPAGKKIIYYPQAMENQYLGGSSYRVANPSGAAGQGGLLTPYEPPGLVVFFK